MAWFNDIPLWCEDQVGLMAYWNSLNPCGNAWMAGHAGVSLQLLQTMDVSRSLLLAILGMI